MQPLIVSLAYPMPIHLAVKRNQWFHGTKGFVRMSLNKPGAEFRADGAQSARQDTATLPIATISEMPSGGTLSTSFLVLRVNIEGRDQKLRLNLSELEDHGMTGPAGVEAIPAEALMNQAHVIARAVADLSKSTHELADAISRKKNQ